VASADELAMTVVMAQTGDGTARAGGGGGVKGRLGHSERGRMVPTELVSALMARRRGRRWSEANAPVKSWRDEGSDGRARAASGRATREGEGRGN
jgi:hypothetical protein